MVAYRHDPSQANRVRDKAMATISATTKGATPA
jgi:hypothetical protein